LVIVTILLPAFDEAQVIRDVISGIHNVMRETGLDYEVVVVDDGSQDGTGELAAKAGARVIRHAYNMGNGAAVKAGIRAARGDITVIIDADGQHDPHDIPRLLSDMTNYGMVVGARTRASQTDWHRDAANAVFNLLASYVTGRPIPDLTSGFRAIHTPLARQFAYLLPNTFSYPTTITLALLRAGHCVAYVPITTAKRAGKSKIKLLQDGVRFLLIIFRITTLFSPLKIFLPVSLSMIGLGVAWYLFTLLTYGPKMPPASVILILSGLFCFLMGLISEQIAQLRFDRSEDSFFAANLPELTLGIGDENPQDGTAKSSHKSA
jgi:glycosyltransferase involved in cell wall biosynthesis